MSKRYLRLHQSHIYPFLSLFTLEAILVFVHGEPLGHHHPSSRALLSLVRFWLTRKSLCMNRVKSLLSLRCMLLAVLIPGLQIAVRAWYSRLSYDQRSITKRMLALEKPVWGEKTRLTSPEVHAAVTQRLDAIQAETLFSRSVKKPKGDSSCRVGWVITGIRHLLM